MCKFKIKVESHAIVSSLIFEKTGEVSYKSDRGFCPANNGMFTFSMKLQ